MEIPKKRGRPRKEQPLTNADRQFLYRQRQKERRVPSDAELARRLREAFPRIKECGLQVRIDFKPDPGKDILLRLVEALEQNSNKAN